MNGIEVLASAQIVTEFAFNWSAFWITFGIIFIVCFGVGILSYIFDNMEWTIIPFLSIIGIFFGILCGGLIGQAIFAKPIDYETQYKITISDEVLMNEFLDQYEVLDQDGKIFTVREKTNDE